MGGPRVLLVDDEQTLLFAISDYFGALGITCHCAGDVASASRMAAANPYDVAIVDLRLGGSDDRGGLGLVNELTRLYPHIKVIVLSAYSDDRAEELREIGADAFCRKPQPLKDLARKVFDLCGLTSELPKELK
jgi:CheY-like chemotaxis protein